MSQPNIAPIVSTLDVDGPGCGLVVDESGRSLAVYRRGERVVRIFEDRFERELASVVLATAVAGSVALSSGGAHCAAACDGGIVLVDVVRSSARTPSGTFLPRDTSRPVAFLRRGRAFAYVARASGARCLFIAAIDGSVSNRIVLSNDEFDALMVLLVSPWSDEFALNVISPTSISSSLFAADAAAGWRRIAEWNGESIEDFLPGGWMLVTDEEGERCRVMNRRREQRAVIARRDVVDPACDARFGEIVAKWARGALAFSLHGECLFFDIAKRAPSALLTVTDEGGALSAGRLSGASVASAAYGFAGDRLLSRLPRGALALIDVGPTVARVVGRRDVE